MIPIASPREIGERPGIMTMDIRGGNLSDRATGCRLCGSDEAGDLGVYVVEVPSV
jgi:hypothetical protein